MKLVVGLGNIGKEYEKTVHNMGFMVIDQFCEQLNLKFNKNICSSVVAEGNIAGEKVIFAKPTTYMNLSGVAVKSLQKKYGIDISKDLLIISDDIDLARGKIRVRGSGSAGTHNGLRNIVECLGSETFARVRIGVGRPNEHQDLADFVLSKTIVDQTLQEGLNKGSLAVSMFIEGKSIADIQQKVN